MEGNLFPEMGSMNLKTFSKLFLIPGVWIIINGLAAKLPHCGRAKTIRRRYEND